MAKKTEETIVTIKPLDIQLVPISIVGDTPLIVHAWSEKAKKMMLEAQTKEDKNKPKAKREPIEEFIHSMYWLTDVPEANEDAFVKAVKKGAKWGFPVGAIKQAANSAAYRLGWVKNQMELRGSYFLKTDYKDMAQIQGDASVMREDMVRIGNGSADLRYRAEYKNWKMDLIIEYNASGNLTIAQIINCINAGGYATGIGEWRPEKDGDFGRFHVEHK